MNGTDSAMHRRLAATLLLPLLVVLSASAARAQAYDSAGAEVLFREGKQLMDRKDYAAACPKLAESYRMDPATGSLLALALCYERSGKLASAWVAYTDAAARAKREGQEDREQVAAAHARALEPKLAKLVVQVNAPNTPGLQVTRDGVELGPAALGVSIPVDPGEHVVEARAPGREPFRQVIEVGAADESTLAVPELAVAAEAQAAAVAPLAPLPHEQQPSEEPTSSDSRSSLSTAGMVVAAAGVVGLAVGTFYGIRALSLKKEADCPSKCSGDDYDTQQDAHDAGNISTIAFVAGGVLTATGVTLYLIDDSSESGATSVGKSYGVSVSGRF